MKRVRTTVEVVRRPTPSAPPVVARPCWQAISATANAKTALLSTPEVTSQELTTRAVWLR